MTDCSRYEMGDPEDYEDLPVYQKLCRCPVCGGFLPQSFPMDSPFKCRKCKTELLVMPDPLEDPDADPEMEGGGRICPISKPNLHFVANARGDDEK